MKQISAFILPPSSLLFSGHPVNSEPTAPRTITVPEKHAARIPYAGDIPLNSIPAGNYILRITVTDRIAGTSATQQTNLAVE